MEAAINKWYVKYNEEKKNEEKRNDETEIINRTNVDERSPLASTR